MGRAWAQIIGPSRALIGKHTESAVHFSLFLFRGCLLPKHCFAYSMFLETEAYISSEKGFAFRGEQSHFQIKTRYLIVGVMLR